MTAVLERSRDNISHDNRYRTVLDAAGLINKIYHPHSTC